jgi:hypothetical protein
MKELLHIRPSYETRRPQGAHVQFPDAHGIVRMAIGVGEVLELPFDLVAPAQAAVERIESSTDDEIRLSTAEVAALAVLVTRVTDVLISALDENDRPVGDGGSLLRREASKPATFEDGLPDLDRMFEVGVDGRITTVHPRISIARLQEVLPELWRFLRDAANRDLERAIVE